MSDETKTSQEVYAAMSAAGVKVGDLVRTSDEHIWFVTRESCDCIRLRRLDWELTYRPTDSGTALWTWPTHFARPCFRNNTFSYEDIAPIDKGGNYAFTMVGDHYYYNTIKINYPEPEPLTLEQRIERLEKLQGVNCHE